jgi:D-glycero-alpha-D-manno-heptose 1-phosphate guanylyltransferase
MSAAPTSQTCIVLAGGLGTRLRAAVADLPKCLAPVGTRPFIAIQISTLVAAGIDNVVLSLGHMADKVIDAVQSFDSHARVRHVVEPSLLGTGGAIAFALDSLGLDEALVANGDTYLDGDIGGMLTPLDRSGGELFRMAVVEVADRSRFGGVKMDGQRWVQGFVEKGVQGPGPINAGLYRLCRAALPAQRAGAYSLEADILPALVLQGTVAALPVAGSFTDIGVPDEYFRFCASHGG